MTQLIRNLYYFCILKKAFNEFICKRHEKTLPFSYDFCHDPYLLFMCRSYIHAILARGGKTCRDVSRQCHGNPLKKINPDDLRNDDERMLHRLLLIEVKDVSYISSPDTTEINSILEYFIGQNRLRRIHPLALY